MTTATLTQSQQSALRPPGTWRLDAARAVTLRPRQDGVLHIAQGRVWATFDGPHGGPPDAHGDHVLGAGERVRVRAGQRVVLESWDRRLPAHFSWDFAPRVQVAPVPRRQAVAQSWGDLRLAAVLGARAGCRLVMALAGLGAGAVLPAPAPRRASA